MIVMRLMGAGAEVPVTAMVMEVAEAEAMAQQEALAEEEVDAVVAMARALLAMRMWSTARMDLPTTAAEMPPMAIMEMLIFYLIS